MKKKSVKNSLSLNKKTIGNLSGINGGRPPHDGGAPADPQPITIETVCWTESRDIASNCWCSSGDSFGCF